LAAALWVAAFTLLGWIFWQSLDDALALAGWGKLVLLAAVVLVVATIVLRAALRSPEWRSRLHPGRSRTDD
jgi:membrane protein DedA with SNARE-associated domain